MLTEDFHSVLFCILPAGILWEVRIVLHDTGFRPASEWLLCSYLQALSWLHIQ
jgi:hypothetical protein